MEKGMTQEMLAEVAELSLAAVQKVEAGQSGSRIETLIKIALVLEVKYRFPLVRGRYGETRGKDRETKTAI